MAERIKTLRIARGLTQKQVGDYCGVTDVSVSAWERGATANVKLATFIRLCEILKTDAHYLIFGPERRHPGINRTPEVPARQNKKDRE